jgi:hypothetical protein
MVHLYGTFIECISATVQEMSMSSKSEIYVILVFSNKLHSGASSAGSHLKELQIFIQTYFLKVRFNTILQTLSINS